jgi:alkylation response protein AidB-like acyl-CoA dehydrogenase
MEPGARHETEVVTTRIARRDGALVLRGTKVLVPGATSADRIIVVARSGDGLALAIVDARDTGVQLTPTATIGLDDRCEATFDDVRVAEADLLGGLGDQTGPLERALARATVALCAEMTGAAERVLEMTVEHAKRRIQFGNPLADLQAIQHRCADVAVAVEVARSLTVDAAREIDRGGAARSRASMAKAHAGEAYRLATWVGAQVHGGAGFMVDHPLGRYYRRAAAAQVTLGDLDLHQQRVAKELLGSD